MMNSDIKTATRVLVTSGGTSEQIDSVRKITNMSTGRLGSLIADAFAREGADVTYVCGEGASRPSLPVEKTLVVRGVRQLQEMLRRLLKERDYDCVVHSMAVSDYGLRGVTTAEEMANSIARALEQESLYPEREKLSALIKEAIQRSHAERSDKKISSDFDDMILLMEKTPKVIQMIKTIQPQTILIGFKLLAGAEKQELVRIAKELMERSNCDFILANDIEDISGDKHKAILMGMDGFLKNLYTKQEIADAIVENALTRIALVSDERNIT